MVIEEINYSGVITTINGFKRPFDLDNKEEVLEFRIRIKKTLNYLNVLKKHRK